MHSLFAYGLSCLQCTVHIHARKMRKVSSRPEVYCGNTCSPVIRIGVLSISASHHFVHVYPRVVSPLFTVREAPSWILNLKMGGRGRPRNLGKRPTEEGAVSSYNAKKAKSENFHISKIFQAKQRAVRLQKLHQDVFVSLCKVVSKTTKKHYQIGKNTTIVPKSKIIL